MLKEHFCRAAGFPWNHQWQPWKGCTTDSSKGQCVLRRECENCDVVQLWAEECHSWSPWQRTESEPCHRARRCIRCEFGEEWQLDCEEWWYHTCRSCDGTQGEWQLTRSSFANSTDTEYPEHSVLVSACNNCSGSGKHIIYSPDWFRPGLLSQAHRSYLCGMLQFPKDEGLTCEYCDWLHKNSSDNALSEFLRNSLANEPHWGEKQTMVRRHLQSAPDGESWLSVIEFILAQKYSQPPTGLMRGRLERYEFHGGFSLHERGYQTPVVYYQ